MSLTESQQRQIQKAFLSFHEKHKQISNVLQESDVPTSELSCSICDWKEDIRINSGINIGLRLASRRHFMYVQSKRKMRNKICPLCKETRGIRKIIWGMPAGEPDETKYFLGGCVSEDMSANYKCIDCAWEGK